MNDELDGIETLRALVKAFDCRNEHLNSNKTPQQLLDEYKRYIEDVKYITILESDNYECPNVGTITNQDVESKFKEAIESHFDAEMIRYKFVNVYTVNDLTDCIGGVSIDVLVELAIIAGEKSEYKIELSETWLY